MESNLGTPGSHLDLGFQRSLWPLHEELIQRESSREAERGREMLLMGQAKERWWRWRDLRDVRLTCGSVSGKEFSKDPKFRQGNILGHPTLITTGHACVPVCVWDFLFVLSFSRSN